MSTNNNLHEAKRAKNDEFYTQLSDIENEVVHYKEHFKDKIVFCNCNDALHSNFAKYFSLNFEHLGLKQLICSSYGEDAHVLIYNGDKNGNNVPDLEEWDSIKLEGNGDFRSEEMIDYLKIADIVVTNPPFSLFREYVAQLVEYDKKFLIIGNMNAITYKEIFPLIKNNKMWLGVSTNGSNRWFGVPNNYEHKENASGYKEIDGKKYLFVNGIMWYTNLDHRKRHEELDLYKHYSNSEYKKFDNFNAINVNKVSDIPIDYDGVIGVPISFLNKYCPTQFEIVGCTYQYGIPENWDKNTNMQPKVNNKQVYKRLLIKKYEN